MILKKTIMLNNIVGDIIKNSIQSALLNVLINKVLPLVINLFKYMGNYSYYGILIYLIISVLILFIIYKLFRYLNPNKNQIIISSSSISSILSRSSDFDLNCHKMEKLKNKKNTSNTKSKKTLTTDLLTSFTH